MTNSMPKLSEAVIRRYTTESSFQRGYSYYKQGAVLSVILRGNQLTAEVEGSQYEPYRVRITLEADGIADAYCSCPYDWGGYCKHIVAVLLTYIHNPELVEERPPLEELLAEMDRDQLRTVLQELVEHHPYLADEVESYVQAVQKPPSDGKPSPRLRRTPLDPAPFRRRVRTILHSLDHMRPSEAYWHVGDLVSELRSVLDQVWEFVEAGDGRSALVVLEAITEEYMDGWTVLDDSDGEASGFFEDLGPLWTEAILSADLTKEERHSLAERLAEWQRELDHYGVEGVFDAAREAAVQGWDYPPLRRVLEGEITRKGAWEGEAPWYADELAVARLKVLERQGRYQEYLYLAEAEGQTERFVTMLVKLGRVQEAVDYGLRYLETTDEALALAEALRERGKVEEGLRIAEHGLDLEGPKAPLARWLRDRALEAGREKLALRSAILAFRELPNLQHYLAVRSSAGDRWNELREEMLAHLRGAGNPYAQVEVFLHEGLVDDAISVADAHPHYYDLVERVVEAALSSHPDWAIRTCLDQAERIVDQGKSKYYPYAVRWLERAKSAYLSAGREEEWRSYLDGLMDRHKRKYSLIPMLEKLK